MIRIFFYFKVLEGQGLWNAARWSLDLDQSPDFLGSRRRFSLISLSSHFFQIIEIFSERDGKSPFREKIFFVAGRRYFSADWSIIYLFEFGAPLPSPPVKVSKRQALRWHPLVTPIGIAVTSSRVKEACDSNFPCFQTSGDPCRESRVHG